MCPCACLRGFGRGSLRWRRGGVGNAMWRCRGAGAAGWALHHSACRPDGPDRSCLSSPNDSCEARGRGSVPDLDFRRCAVLARSVSCRLGSALAAPIDRRRLRPPSSPVNTQKHNILWYPAVHNHHIWVGGALVASAARPPWATPGDAVWRSCGQSALGPTRGGAALAVWRVAARRVAVPNVCSIIPWSRKRGEWRREGVAARGSGGAVEWPRVARRSPPGPRYAQLSATQSGPASDAGGIVEVERGGRCSYTGNARNQDRE